jgi:adenylylsulfate kinase-like enzyme
MIIWIFGRSGSGKTTLANALGKLLSDKSYAVELLDGDDVRRWLTPDCDFSEQGRWRNLERAARVASLLARNRVIVLCAFVTPFEWMRRALTTAPGVRLVYCAATEELCRSRDPKGLYASRTPGIEVFEEPESSSVLSIATGFISPQQAANTVAQLLGLPIEGEEESRGSRHFSSRIV